MLLIGIGLGCLIASLTSVYVMTLAVREDRIKERLGKQANLLDPWKERWKNDCDTLMTAWMYGNPPGGWSDPERCAKFSEDVADIERRLRDFGKTYE
jgi:hypothetical protein